MSGKFIFCPLCAERLETVLEGERERKKCPTCGFVQYKNPVCAAGVVIIENGSVLLVKRRYDPYRGMWAIPSGFVEYEEDLKTTAARELEEETGLEVHLERLLAAESCFDDPRGNSILVLYEGRIKGGRLRPGDDAEEVRFFSLSQLPPLAFEVHRKVLGELAGRCAI